MTPLHAQVLSLAVTAFVLGMLVPITRDREASDWKRKQWKKRIRALLKHAARQPV